MTMPTPIAHVAGLDERLASAEQGARVKVCGITDATEIDLLGSQQVDFVGLWHGVPGGPADLPLEDWRRLGAAAAATGSLTPVLVTFLSDAEEIRLALEGSPVHWVQLHGYPPPRVVAALKAAVPGVRVIKVLHVRKGACVERRLIGAYEEAGTDVFIFDAVTEDGRVGSTGQTLDAGLVASLAEGLTRPFLLAGGISDSNRDAYDALVAHPRFLGVDVDTNARGPDGKVSAERVAAICAAWKPHA